MKKCVESVLVVVTFFLIALLDEGTALAAGFATARYGGEHGNVTETNPFALYYNPGALGFSHAPLSGMLDVQVALRDVSWTHTAPEPTSSQQPNSQFGNSGKATAFNVFGAPAMATTAKFGNFAFGIGFFAPFGGRAHWDQNGDQLTQQNPALATKYPRSAAGVARWHIIDGELSSVYFTAGAGYRIGPLSLGVSGNLVLSDVRLSQAKNPNGGTLPDTTSEGRASLEVEGWDGSFGAGAMLEIVPDHAWVGASYQSQPGFGLQTLNGTLAVNDPIAAHPAVHYNVTFTQALPDIYRAGARWRINDAVELRLFGDYTRWSAMVAQCVALQTKAKDGSLISHDCLVDQFGSDASGGFIFTNVPRKWNDTYGVRLGGSYWLNPDIELFAGVGYETAAVPDSTLEPGLMDADNIGGAIGARFQAWDDFYIAVSYTHLQFLDRDNTGKSQLETINGMSVAYPTVQQDGGGQYSQWIGVIDVNAQKEF
jgi:long-chain fatty acid transport protein